MKKNRRRRTSAKVGDVIKTHTLRDRRGALYWMIEPERFRPGDGIPNGTEIHGPFITDSELWTHQRITLLGPDCVVTDGGAWDPAWDRLQ